MLAALDKPSQWETFDAVAQIHGEDRSEAEDLLADLKDALTSDEYAVALEPHLDSALTQAIRLLRPKKPADHADTDADPNADVHPARTGR